MQNIQHTCTFC